MNKSSEAPYASPGKQWRQWWLLTSVAVLGLGALLVVFLPHLAAPGSTQQPPATSTRTIKALPCGTAYVDQLLANPHGDMSGRLNPTSTVSVSTLLPEDGDLTVTMPGTVIDGVDLRGNLTIAADDVTVRNSRITGLGYSVITVAPGARGAVVENVLIDGGGTSGSSGSAGITGSAHISGVEITGVENGIVPGNGTSITNVCIHRLSAPGSPHYDGVQMDGGLSDILIENSVIDMSEHDQTATVMADNEFGPLTRIVVRGNVLAGGSYVLYVDGRKSGAPIDSSVVVEGNVLTSGKYGEIVRENTTAVVRSNQDEKGNRLPDP